MKMAISFFFTTDAVALAAAATAVEYLRKKTRA